MPFFLSSSKLGTHRRPALNMAKSKDLTFPLLILFMVLVTGTVGYWIIEDWSLLESLYMTVITLSTIGFREVHNPTPAGMVFTMFLVFFGVGSMAYALKTATQILLEVEFRNVLGRRKVKKTIGGLKGHYIICGYGRMGKIVAREFLAEGVPFVIVEKDPEVIAEVTDPNILFLHADSTQDAALEEASISSAKGLISVLQSDADNLLVVLSARSMNPSLRIVARAGADGVEAKLKRAGATKVVSPYHMGGIRIAQAVLKPAVTDFLEFTFQDKTVDLELEQLVIGNTSTFVGKTLTESNIRQDYGVILVAIKRSDGKMLYNPTRDTTIEAGDTFVVLGERTKLEELESISGVDAETVN